VFGLNALGEGRVKQIACRYAKNLDTKCSI
jgi:hypothetical protein